MIQRRHPVPDKFPDKQHLFQQTESLLRLVIGFTGKQDIFTIYQSHVTITSVKTFHCQLLHFLEFYDLIFFDDYSVYQ